MELELRGKRVLITGALGGFGRAFVRGFQSEGATVIATGTRPQDAVAPELEEFEARPAYFQMRLDREDEIKEVVAAADAEIVVSNAGLTHSGPLTGLSLADWRKVMEVNLTGSFLVGREAGKIMAGRGEGAMIFISSWAQNVPGHQLGAYSPSKGGLRLLALALAKELAPHGVRVNLLLPGIIDSGMAKAQMDREPARRERAQNLTPCGRLGTAREMADAVLWLASPRAGFCFGAEILADGGASLGR